MNTYFGLIIYQVIQWNNTYAVTKSTFHVPVLLVRHHLDLEHR